MKLKLNFILLFCMSVVSAQNLVPNPNFEEYSSCPTDTGTFTTLDWITPFWPGSPNYFNICGELEVNIPNNFAGYQESATGEAYVGIYTYGLGTREFIQGVLTTPTIAGVSYELTIIYSSSDNYGHSDGLGMLLSVGAPTSYMGQNPQMEKIAVVESQTEWHTLTYEYVSAGGETHVTIGNFNNDFNSNYVPEGMYETTAYYYIDSVAVKCIGIASSDIVVDLGGDMEICDSEFPITIISSLSNAYNEWSTGEIGASIEVNSPGEYFVKSSINCEYGVDTIKITRIEEPETLIDEEMICGGEVYTIQLDTDLGSYEWDNGSISSDFVVMEDGLYTVSLTHTCGIIEDSVHVILGNVLTDSSLLDVYTLCNNESLSIDLSDVAADNILWDNGSIDVKRTFEEPGSYFVELTNACGDTIFHFDFEQEFCARKSVYVPNAFSPNNDGINDYFSIWFSETWLSPRIKLQIYDRWGGHIFYSEDPYFRWAGDFKGKSLNSGIYIYYYELEFEINGKRQIVRETGDVNIVK